MATWIISIFRPYILYLIVLIGGLVGGYIYGVQATEKKELVKQIEQQAKAQSLMKTLQEKIDRLTNNYLQSNIQYEKKYTELKNENDILHDNLNSCMLSVNRMRVLVQSANAEMPATIRPTGNERVYAESATTNFSAADLSSTIIEHDKLYFKCKTKLDFWQNYYNQINQ